MKKITISIAFTFLANLSGVISLIQQAANIKGSNMNFEITIKVISIIATFAVAYYFFSKLFDLKKKIEQIIERNKFELQASAILYTIKGQRAFIRSYKNVNFYRLPNDTDHDFWSRLPEGGLLREELLAEYEEAKTVICDNWKNKSIQEVEDFLKPLFP